jgi:hypothetical protein
MNSVQGRRLSNLILRTGPFFADERDLCGQLHAHQLAGPVLRLRYKDEVQGSLDEHNLLDETTYCLVLVVRVVRQGMVHDYHGCHVGMLAYRVGPCTPLSAVPVTWPVEATDDQLMAVPSR